MSETIFSTHLVPDSSAPENLMVNLLFEPFGVSPSVLRFSWLVPALGNQPLQTAWRIQVSKLSNDFDNRVSIIWDSEEVESTSSVAAPYAGEPLDSDATYFWRVKSWVSGNESSWSQPQKFITAAADTDWQAKAIWVEGSASNSATVDPYNWMLTRKEFSASTGLLASAWIRITAQSPEAARQYVYKLWLNNNLIGLGPVRAQNTINEEARYHIYDISDQLQEGGNVVAALAYANDNHAFMLDLVVQNTDGTKSVLCSSSVDWKARSAGAWLPDKGFLNTTFYKAPYEYIDARNEPLGWLTLGFDDSQWNNAVLTAAVRNLKPALSGRMILRKRSTISITSLGTNHWLLDVGKEVVGGILINVTGSTGMTLEIRLGEEKNGDGGARYQLRSGLTYREIWTLRDGEQLLQHWGYRAFRWVEILASGDVDISNAVNILVLKMPWDDEQSSFSSSTQALDDVYNFCRYTIEGTRLDLYQDTPTRERGPYEGDAVINQLSEYYTQRSWALARYSTGYFIHRRTWPAEYYLMAPILAWQDYLYTGDIFLLAEEYDGLKNHTFDNYLNSNGVVEKDIGESSVTNGDLVDWPTSNRDGYDLQRINTVINAWQYACYHALAKISAVLNYTSESTNWANKATTLRNYFNTNFIGENHLFFDGYNTNTHAISDHQSQHATAFSLALGLVKDSAQEVCGKALANDISLRGIRTSVYGAQFLLEALMNSGQAGTAINFLTDTTMYSWRNMIDTWGATMVMEAWDPSMKSNTTFSHSWGTAPANIIPRFIAGVQVTKAGAEEITIFPNPGTLNDFIARVPVIRGIIEVKFNRNASEILLLTLPPNVKGKLILDLTQIPEINKNTVSVFDGNGNSIAAIISGDRLIVEEVQPISLKVVN